MTQKQATKLFVNFLRENGAYMAFRANMLQQNRKYHYKRYNFFAPLQIMGNTIDRELSWMNTMEGHSFWCRLDGKFRSLYEKMRRSANN